MHEHGWGRRGFLPGEIDKDEVPKFVFPITAYIPFLSQLFVSGVSSLGHTDTHEITHLSPDGAQQGIDGSERELAIIDILPRVQKLEIVCLKADTLLLN